MDDFFYELTPDRVLDAIEAGGLEPTGHCSGLRCFENRVYDLRLEDETHVVAKFYRPNRWTREGILDEHRFLTDLRDAEIPVCAPQEFPGGGTLREVKGIHYAIWPRTGGRSPDELHDEYLPILGRLLARLHNTGAAGDAPHRPRLDAEYGVLEPLDFLDQEGFLPPSCESRYRAAVEEVADLYSALSEGVPMHRIHGDCHRGNLLNGDQGWFFLDFDDCCVGPAVQDVWILVPGRDAEAARHRAVLLDAYRSFRDFDEGWLRLVEPLRAFRFVYTAAWVARRWEEPTFRSAYPHFGTEQYWQNETTDLEELVGRLPGHGEGAPAPW